MTRNLALATFTTTLAFAALTGCASDPNKNLKTAQAEEAEGVRRAKEDVAEDRRDNRVDQASAAQQQDEKHASNYAGATSDRMDAQAEMRAAREKHRAKTQERLDKATARLQEARKNLQIAGNKAPTDMQTRVQTAETQKSLVEKSLHELSGIRNEDWKGATENLAKQLDELDKLVDEAHDRATKVNR